MEAHRFLTTWLRKRAWQPTPISILAWRIPWTGEPGGLRSTGLQWVSHDWSHLARTHNLCSYSVLGADLEPRHVCTNAVTFSIVPLMVVDGHSKQTKTMGTVSPGTHAALFLGSFSVTTKTAHWVLGLFRRQNSQGKWVETRCWARRPACNQDAPLARLVLPG